MKFKAVINKRLKYYLFNAKGKYRELNKCQKNSSPTNKSQSATSKLKPRVIHFPPARKSSFLGYLYGATKAHKSIKCRHVFKFSARLQFSLQVLSP